MQITLDTNTLIRFFTNDLPKQAREVKTLFETGKDLLIPDVVFPEVEYILGKQYGLSRMELIEKFEFLLSQDSITVSHTVKKAISFYISSKLDMADCIIAAHSLKGKLASFDKELLVLDGVTSVWKK
ncbi:MAG: PIN domain-containing protein [Candidatus Levyibacteriota bacterium]